MDNTVAEIGWGYGRDVYKAVWLYLNMYARVAVYLDWLQLSKPVVGCELVKISARIQA